MKPWVNFKNLTKEEKSVLYNFLIFTCSMFIGALIYGLNDWSVSNMAPVIRFLFIFLTVTAIAFVGRFLIAVNKCTEKGF